MRPAASQASAQRMPSPPAFVSTATRRPLGSRLVREQRGDVDQLLERGGADDAGLVEERVDGGLGAGERRGVRARRLLPGRRRAALEREDRLRCGRRGGRARPKRRGLPNDSTYISTTSVASSSSHHSSRSFVETSALLPIETNAESPSPRDSAASRSARPSAPLCEEKPMLPAGAERAAKVAFRLGPATAMPRQLGPISRAPCDAHEREQLLLPLDSLAADLGEAGRDHDERADALAQRLLGRAEHRRAGQRDHGQVDRVGDLLDRRGSRGRRRPARRRG